MADFLIISLSFLCIVGLARWLGPAIDDIFDAFEDEEGDR